MNEQFEHLDDDSQRRLWQQYAAANENGAGHDKDPEQSGVPDSGFDEIDLAAYLDGRAADELTAQIEQRMADDADFLDAVIELRTARADAESAQSREVPHRVLRVAIGLREPSLKFTDYAPRRWAQRLGQVAAAAVLMLAGTVGYQTGMGTNGGDESAAAAAAVADWGLDEMFDDSGFSLLAVSPGGGM